MKSLLFALGFAFLAITPLQAQQLCKIYDSSGHLIYEGICDADHYVDTCLDELPWACPVERCSGGKVGDVSNGDRCLAGTAVSGGIAPTGEGSIIGTPGTRQAICYCDVPEPSTTDPLLKALGFALTVMLLRRRFA